MKIHFSTTTQKALLVSEALYIHTVHPPPNCEINVFIILQIQANVHEAIWLVISYLEDRHYLSPSHS